MITIRLKFVQRLVHLLIPFRLIGFFDFLIEKQINTIMINRIIRHITRSVMNDGAVKKIKIKPIISLPISVRRALLPWWSARSPRIFSHRFQLFSLVFSRPTTVRHVWTRTLHTNRTNQR